MPRAGSEPKRIAGMPPGVVIRLFRDAARSCGVVMTRGDGAVAERRGTLRSLARAREGSERSEC